MKIYTVRTSVTTSPAEVHDELVFEVPEKEAEEFAKWVVNKMSGALKLSVPLKVDAGTGKNWSEAH